LDAVPGYDPRKPRKAAVKPWSEWKLADFETGKALGEGAFGHVYLARTKREKFILALKVLHLEQVKKENLQLSINRETEIHAQLLHENIIQMYGFFRDDDKIVCILEYAPGGEVYNELMSQPNQRFDNKKAATYIYQVSRALEYLHDLGIMHRDLKPENLLRGYYGEIKLTDFGYSIQTNRRSKERRKTFCGTLDYVPPEMVSGQEYDEKVDIWSLGVLAFEFLVGKPPFETDTNEETYELIKTLKFKFPTCVSSRAQDLISKVLKTEPSERLSLQDIRNHGWCRLNFSAEKKLVPLFDEVAHLEQQVWTRYEEAKQIMEAEVEANLKKLEL